MFVLITTYVVYSAWRQQWKGSLLEIAHLRRQKGQEKNLQLKIEMIKEYESGTFKHTELASKYGIGKSAMSDILKQRDVLKKEWENNGSKSKPDLLMLVNIRM